MDRLSHVTGLGTARARQRDEPAAGSMFKWLSVGGRVGSDEPRKPSLPRTVNALPSLRNSLQVDTGLSCGGSIGAGVESIRARTFERITFFMPDQACPNVSEHL